MASNYDKNRWELYNPDLPNEQQPHSFITKRKLDKMEQGIEDANVTLEVGEIKMAEDYGVTITEDEVNKTRKLNITFPPAGQGAPGKDGASAYDTWLAQGNEGSEQEFLDYLKGADGKDGKDGRDGQDGAPGPAGDSAYQTWLSLGNSGSEQDFLNSLAGEDGMSAYEVWKSLDGNENKSIIDFFDSLEGRPGCPGPPGPPGRIEIVYF